MIRRLTCNTTKLIIKQFLVKINFCSVLLWGKIIKNKTSMPYMYFFLILVSLSQQCKFSLQAEILCQQIMLTDTVTGLSLRGRGKGIPLAKMSMIPGNSHRVKKKTEPKESPSNSTPSLLTEYMYIQQLEVLVAAML